MRTATVKAVLLEYNDARLRFDLVFEDGCVKHVDLDRYGIKAIRSASLRDIIEQSAVDYFDSLGQSIDVVSIIFA